ncbi:MAG: hypothetical protein ACHREM_32630, partial [Polyangiales bacterium]
MKTEASATGPSVFLFRAARLPSASEPTWVRAVRLLRLVVALSIVACGGASASTKTPGASPSASGSTSTL